MHSGFRKATPITTSETGKIMTTPVQHQSGLVLQSTVEHVEPASPVDETTFLERRTAQFGPARTTTTAAIANSSSSSVKTVGSAPNGYGQQILWDPNDSSLAVVVYLAAADDLGVMISGVQPGDQIKWISATGIASFSDDTNNNGVASIIGIVGDALSLGAKIFGIPEAAPFIQAGAQYAAKQFPESTSPSKRRDPFGVDPSSGLKARAEGGVLISLPQAGQNYYSGDSDHQSRWIKQPGDRVPANYPADIPSGNAYFLSPLENPWAYAGTAGDFIIYPWDSVFDDNNGYYRLDLLLTRAAALPTPPPVE
jgi:hypothetical protein